MSHSPSLFCTISKTGHNQDVAKSIHTKRARQSVFLCGIGNCSGHVNDPSSDKLWLKQKQQVCDFFSIQFLEYLVALRFRFSHKKNPHHHDTTNQHTTSPPLSVPAIMSHDGTIQQNCMMNASRARRRIGNGCFHDG